MLSNTYVQIIYKVRQVLENTSFESHKWPTLIQSFVTFFFFSPAMVTSIPMQEMKRHAILIALAANHRDLEISTFIKMVLHV